MACHAKSSELLLLQTQPSPLPPRPLDSLLPSTKSQCPVKPKLPRSLRNWPWRVGELPPLELLSRKCHSSMTHTQLCSRAVPVISQAPALPKPGRVMPKTALFWGVGVWGGPSTFRQCTGVRDHGWIRTTSPKTSHLGTANQEMAFALLQFGVSVPCSMAKTSSPVPTLGPIERHLGSSSKLCQTPVAPSLSHGYQLQQQ